MKTLRYGIKRRIQNMVRSEGTNNLRPGFLEREDKDIEKLTDKFIEGMAKELNVSRDEVDKDIAKKWAENWRGAYLAGEESRALENIRSIARESKRLAGEKITNKYAEGMSKSIDKPIDNIKSSKPVQNFRKRLLE